MNPAANTRLRVGGRLPPAQLPGPRGAIPLQTSPQRRLATVLFLFHGDGDCAACHEHVRRLAGEVDWRDWDGRFLVLTRGGEAADVPVPPPARVAHMEPATAAGTSGTDNGLLLIADRYGQIYHIAPIEADSHAIPDPGEVEEWLRFLATQCPECGVPDQPAGW
jgi:hypothetical protein